MPTYVFKGRNRLNEIIVGERVADNREALRQILRREQVTLTSVKEKGREIGIPKIGGKKKVKSKDLATLIPASVTDWNTVKLEVHGTQYTASLNGMMVFQFTDAANLVDSGGIALATQNGGIAEFDDAVATPF